ncbi:DUF4265 domain-containing protein [Actinomadura sp. HBU206391]|nr:DUF4265 domain-containing protein [Actinomadura sp. HBU206391]
MGFPLDPPDEDGWPPASSEWLWVLRLIADVAKIDNIPFFVRNLALGDLLQTSVDGDGRLRPEERLKWSGHCTIRVTPFAEGAPWRRLSGGAGGRPVHGPPDASAPDRGR